MVETQQTPKTQESLNSEESMNRQPFVIMSAMVCIAGGIQMTPLLGQSQANSTASVWTADQSILPELEKETPLNGYQLRPPKGYAQMDTEGSEGMKSFVWKGAERTDGSSPFVMALIIAAPPGETNMPPAEHVLKKHLAGVEQRRADWQQTPPETGQINGVPFVRARWSGTDNVTGKKMRGFIYVTATDTHIIQISSQDVAPHDEQALKLAETSALTFRKK